MPGDLLHLHRKLDRLTLLVATMFDAQQRAFHTLDVEIHQMAGELDALTAQVAANTDAEQSAITLLTSLHQLLADAIASGDPAKLTALRDQLATSKDALAAAVVANTPVA
jgi:hypothetical protein